MYARGRGGDLALMTLLPTPTVTSQNRRPVTESSERFLRAIVSDVTIERLDELHLFTALRQGVYETGVAVIAVSPVDGDRSEPARHIVYTARYRLVVKGTDRGRWEFECVAEADAPLITVETVVRGVQRRSGDLDDPVRYDMLSLAHVLRLEPPHALVGNPEATDGDELEADDFEQHPDETDHDITHESTLADPDPSQPDTLQ